MNRKNAKIDRLREEYVLPYKRFQFNKSRRSSYITVASIQRVKQLKQELNEHKENARNQENRIKELEEELGQSFMKYLKHLTLFYTIFDEYNYA